MLRKTFQVALAILLLGAGITASSVQDYRPEVPLGLDAYLPVPEENPLTREKIALGRKLFFDPILSLDHRTKCASCHDPAHAFADGQSVAVGIFGRKGTRSTPTLLNRGYGTAFFWDGRASSLEEQVLQPIQNQRELGMSIGEVMTRLRRSRQYRNDFRVAFGRDPNPNDLAQALASYVRTIFSGNSPFDRYQNGDMGALNPEALCGLQIFRGKGNCVACHVGPNFTDDQFHNTGVAWKNGQLADSGRYAITSKDPDHGAFKVPTLREVAHTDPYMHDGSLATLEDVVEFYNRGGNPNPWLDAEIHPLHLTAAEKHALVSFLRSLSGTIQQGLDSPRQEP